MGIYQRGKIYKIVSEFTDKIYVGSTAELRLCRRMNGHRTDYRRFNNGKHNYISSLEILQYDDAKIVLIEDYPCKSRDQLLAREDFWIRKLRLEGVDVVNQIHSVFDVENKKAKEKEYRKNHKEKIKEYNKAYYKTHKEQIKGYYENNKKQILKKQKEQKSKTETCLYCDITYRRDNHSKHKRTKNHIHNKATILEILTE